MNPEAGVRIALKRALVSLDAVALTIHSDVEAATDDLVAARLLVATALTMLGTEPDGHEIGGTRASPPPQTSIGSPRLRRNEPSPPQST
jgi:hypothetical protein